MAEPNYCRGCGEKRPSDAPSGLCPACLLKAGLLAEGSQLPDVTITFGPASSSVLAAFGEAFGNIPPVLLRDADSTTEPGPVIRPSSTEIPDAAERSARLQLFGEIARGGMGAVLKGRDSDLGRDLAVKVLLESHRDKPDMIRRFIEEAQIAGQLQHPGIVPIYELGAFGDRRPYFAMKLVKGHTLAEILANRKSPGDDLARLLSIFESVCQTMAYAHARGVIHRDLKPSNVMVGSFGEVQVMDWGLAKVLPRGGAVEDASAGHTKEQGTIIATARSGSDSNLSQAGSVMGTPSYMAPEQARGEGGQVDERADVFALGSIFCELLTGEPAFTGRNSGEIQRKAARGELADPMIRLNQNRLGHDPELISLANACLGSERDDRPRDAGELAERMSLYHSRAQDRLRHSEIARAEEKARAEEATKRASVERDRLRLTVALAASILGLVVIGSGGWAYLVQQRAARRAAAERVINEALDLAILLRGQARAAQVDDLSEWKEAIAAANQARSSLDAGEPTEDLRARVFQTVATIEREQASAAHRAKENERDRKFLERLENIRNSAAEDPSHFDYSDPQKLDSDYSSAFREFGINPELLDPQEAGRRLRERSRPLEIALFLDDWALTRRSTRDDKSWQRLIATARTIDVDPWRDDLRKLIDGGGREAFERLAANQAALASQPARCLYFFSEILNLNAGDQRNDPFRLLAMNMLKCAWRRSPGDYLICRAMSRMGTLNPSEMGDRYQGRSGSIIERLRFDTAAVAANPANAHADAALAETLVPLFVSRGHLTNWPPLRSGWVAIDPKWVDPEDLNDANSENREAIRLDSTIWYVRSNLGNLLTFKGEIEAAVAEYREAARLNPKDVAVHQEAAERLYLRGRLDLAITELQAAIRFAHASNGVTFDPLLLQERMFLGTCYQEQGKLSQAFAMYREVLKLGGYWGRPHRHALQATGKPEEVLDAFREAIRLHPKKLGLHYGIGEVLSEAGKAHEADAAYDGEIALLREELKQEPNEIKFRIRLGKAPIARGNRTEAVDQFHEAIKLKPQPDVLKDLAWSLATSARTKLRDGKLAVEFATKSCKLTEWTDADCQSALAASYAEAGDFDTAVKWQTKAIERFFDAKEKEDYRMRLRLYQEKKPYHEHEP